MATIESTREECEGKRCQAEALAYTLGRPDCEGTPADLKDLP